MPRCKNRGKTVHIPAVPSTDTCSLGVPVPTHSFPGPLCGGFGMCHPCGLMDPAVQRPAMIQLQHVNLASSAPTHAVSQSHHMVAQADCLRTCLVPVLPWAAWGCLFACLSHTVLQCFRAAVQQYGMAVDTPAMSQTASAHSCLCVFCVPAPPPDSMRIPVGTPATSHHLHVAVRAGLVIHIPNPPSLAAWPRLFTM